MDPMISATFALHSNRGVYALLLGSGISSSAGVLTGHGVMLDLIQQVAAAKGEQCEPSPGSWFARTFAKEAHYAQLLEVLAGTPSDRQALLRRYFEPSDDEFAQGLKRPGRAHHAIARLVVSGHVRVIITTNFDRLTEIALQEAGVAPVVISTDSHAVGAAPLAHQRAVVLKVNGDYLDQVLRNSPAELSSYPNGIQSRLAEVFDDYGLIVCGWSATYDVALREVLAQAHSRRYSTFWIDHGNVSDDAERLIRLHGAHFVKQTADDFFEGLAGGIEGLVRFGQTDPLTQQVLLARMKRFLGDARFDVDLHELVTTESLEVAKRATTLPQLRSLAEQDPTAVLERIWTYNGITQRLTAMLFNGALLGSSRHVRLWMRAIRSAAPSLSVTHDRDFGTIIRDYPGMVLFYAAGVGAVAADEPDVYCTLLCGGRDPRQKEAAEFVARWHAETIPNFRNSPLDQEALTGIPSDRRSWAPLSELVLRLLWTIAAAHMDEALFLQAFHRWDLLVSLFRANCMQFREQPYTMSLGLFAWRGMTDTVRGEIRDLGDRWAPVERRLFGESVDRVVQLLLEVDQAKERKSY